MIIEDRDPISGAIRFKEDEDTKNLKYIIRKMKELEERVEKLESRIEKDS